MSNLIKSTAYIPLDGKVQLDPMPIEIHTPPQETVQTQEERQAVLAEEEQAQIDEYKAKLRQEAEQTAEQIVRQATEEAKKMKEQAESEIEAWWNERREADQALINEHHSAGYQQGYADGFEQAKKDVLAEYEDKLQEAVSVLEAAQQESQKIILKAEPFLLSLSTSIAEKIIRKQLTLEPEWVIDMIRQTLEDRRDRGLVTLCVNPKHYELVKGYREELQAVIDSQADLKIVPDSSVQDDGCVVRTSYGSLDATVSTQIAEIKKELLNVAAASEANAGE